MSYIRYEVLGQTIQMNLNDGFYINILIENTYCDKNKETEHKCHFYITDDYHDGLQLPILEHTFFTTREKLYLTLKDFISDYEQEEIKEWKNYYKFSLYAIEEKLAEIRKE